MENHKKERVGIFIIAYNTHRFLPKQLELINKYCTDDEYVIHIINNSPLASSENDGIEYQANRTGAVYLKIIPDEKSNNPSCSHANACNFVYREMGRDFDYCLFLDHDIFPIRTFSVKEKLKGKMMAGVEEIRLSSERKVQYLWPGLLFMNNTTIPKEDREMVDFMPTSKYGIGVDSGGGLHELIKKNGENNFLFLSKKTGINEAFDKNRYSYYQIVDDGWMHFINGSNWANLDNEDERLNSLFDILEQNTQDRRPVTSADIEKELAKNAKCVGFSFNFFNKTIFIKITDRKLR